MSRLPTANIDYTSRDYEAFRDLLITKLREKMPEYTDTSGNDAGIVILESLANGLDILSLYADIVANDVILMTTQDRGIAVLLANCLGYYPYNQTASEYEQVFVLEAALDVDYTIPAGTVVTTQDSSDLDTVYFETMEDLVIPAGNLGNETDDYGNYLYTVTVEQGTTISDDVVGTSSGAPLQRFELKYSNVLIDSIQLYINEGLGPVLWERVDNFIESDENSLVYMTSVDEYDICTIIFGNGIKGKIPTSYSNGIIATYRIGGGVIGNVNSNTIIELDTGLPYVESTFNLSVSVRGHDKESLDSIKQNAPAAYRTRDRLVTLQDYEDLIRINFYDFLDLKAVRDSEDRRHAKVYYILKEDYEMTENLMDSVKSFVASRSMIGTEFSLLRYIGQVVNISATMYLDKDYDKDSLVESAIDYLNNTVFSYGNYVFGDKIVKSDLENEVKSKIKGVLSFRVNEPLEDIITPIGEEYILMLGEVSINAIPI